MDKFKWLKGRQFSCEYNKMCFWCFKFLKFGFDCYILKYPPFAYLPEHVDYIDNGKHFRLNIVIKSGEFKVFSERNIFSFFNNRITFFRPDLYKHSMENGDKYRYVLSLGFAKFN